MSEIPGSEHAPPSVDERVDTRNETIDREHGLLMLASSSSRPDWYSRPRWEQFAGKQPPMTAARVFGVDEKRTGVVLAANGDTIGGGLDGHASKKNKKPTDFLRECASGSELLAGFASGELYPFPLENRRYREQVPTTSTPCKWKMRAEHARIVSVIATGIIGLKKRGVVISHGELARLAFANGRRVIGLEERQIGTRVRELVAWGLLKATPMFVPKGCVTSRRANVYRLTTLALSVWRLRVPDACGDMPAPDTDRSVKPRQPKALAPAAAGVISSKVTPDPDCQDQQELPGNPETPLRGDSSGEHEPCRVLCRGDGQAVAAADLSYGSAQRIAVQSHREAREGANCDAVGRLYKPGDASSLPSPASDATTLELARRLGDVVPDAQRGDVRERRSPDPDDDASLERVRRSGARREQLSEREELERKQREIQRTVERRRRERAGELLDDDAMVNDGVAGDGLPDADMLEHLRRIRDSQVDEKRERERYNLNRAVRPAPADDFADVLDSALNNWAARRGVAVPVAAKIVVDKLRGGSDGNGGAS